MGSIFHIAEVAVLLLLAYSVGWAAAYFGRRAIARRPASPLIPAERIDAATRETVNAVAQPVVAVPVGTVPLEIAVAPIPELAALPVVEIPATAPVADASTRHPEPAPAAVAPPPVPAMPASEPGLAWAGERNGQSAVPFEPPVMATLVVEEPTLAAVEAVIESAVEEPLLPMFDEIAPVVQEAAPESPQAPPSDLPEPEPAIAARAELEPLVPASAEPANVSPPVAELGTADPVRPSVAAVEPTVVVAEPSSELDENEAMRAIEGGWSRRKGGALAGDPELADVSRAVAAAQSAVEQVLAQSGIEVPAAPKPVEPATTKPPALARPRDGKRDSLRLIGGVSPLDEATLNNLGIFHFDQIASWDPREVLWLENHAFARGRIGRESWQEQARVLAAQPEQRAARF